MKYWRKLILGVFSLLMLATAPSYAAEKGWVEIRGLAPAYQVGKHTSHDRFCYGGGKCILKGKGEIKIKLNPKEQKGEIVATFDGPDGKWKIVAKKFKMVRTDVNLHGASGGDIDPQLSPPVLPQIWTYVATWGPATVWHNGKKAWMGPAHLMVTEEVRNPKTGKVDFKGPMKAKDYPGSVYNKYGMQIHFVAHPEENPVKGYLPPYTKFVHLMWESVLWE